MTTREYLLTLTLAAIFSWAAWLLVVFKINPEENTSLALGLFLLSLFFALTSSLTLIGYGIRKVIYQKDQENYLSVGLRQGLLLSTFISITLLLVLREIFTWWAGFILLVILILVEFYFINKEYD